mgnify:CR=1 FL=1
MKRDTIKKVLFTIASLTALPLFAAEFQQDDLVLVEDMPIEIRAVAHKKVIDFLIKNPDQASLVKIIALDKEGKVYVLDENLAKIKCLGAPSSISSGM